MSCLETNGSPQLELVQSFLRGFEKKDVGLIEKTLHKDHLRIYHPRSVGMPVQTKEEYIKTLTELIGLWTEQEQSIHSVVEVPGKVIVHLTVKAKTSLGVDMNREMIFIGHIVTDEDGSLKLKQIEEFVDSIFFAEFFKTIAEEKAKRQNSASFVA